MNTPHSNRTFRPTLDVLEDRTTPADLASDIAFVGALHAQLPAIQAALPGLLNNPQTVQALASYEVAVFQKSQEVVADLNASRVEVLNTTVDIAQSVAANPNLTPGQVAAFDTSLLNLYVQTDQFLLNQIYSVALDVNLLFALSQQTALAAFRFGLPGTGILGSGGVYQGNVAGSASSSIATHSLSGTVQINLQGDGSLANPFRGSMTVSGSDTVSGMGFQTQGFSSAPASIQSNLRQIAASGSGNGFTFSFNGFVSIDGMRVTGTLTVTLVDGATAQLGVVANKT